MKIMKEEELNKVAGGFDLGLDVIVFYRETDGGQLKEYNIGPGEPAEQRAKDWCTQNNVLYDSYKVGESGTYNFDTNKLLNSL